MSEITQLVATIKRELKARGLTYRDVARGLHVSEASVKRLFATRRFTLARLAEISGLLDMTLAELAQSAAATTPRLHTLTHAQEATVLADTKLLLTAVCVLNHWSVGDIVAEYRLSEAECFKRLAVLDRMGLIELLPGNRVRPRIARDFDWLPAGPIRKYFRDEGQEDFLDAPFGGEHETIAFLQAMLTAPAQSQLMQELRRLRVRFAALHEESVPAPFHQRFGVGVLLAVRRWEPAGFKALRRT